MALQSGRKGISPKDVTNTGRIKQSAYSLPIASATVLGGVKIGDNINIDSSGKISTPTELPSISASVAGDVLTVKEDGSGVEWSEPSGGGHLYNHNIYAYTSSVRLYINVVSARDTAYTWSDFCAFVNTIGTNYAESKGILPCFGLSGTTQIVGISQWGLPDMIGVSNAGTNVSIPSRTSSVTVVDSVYTLI